MYSPNSMVSKYHTIHIGSPETNKVVSRIRCNIHDGKKVNELYNEDGSPSLPDELVTHIRYIIKAN